jgi:hypothetical protein
VTPSLTAVSVGALSSRAFRIDMTGSKYKPHWNINQLNFQPMENHVMESRGAHPSKTAKGGASYVEEGIDKKSVRLVGPAPHPQRRPSVNEA